MFVSCYPLHSLNVIGCAVCTVAKNRKYLLRTLVWTWTTSARRAPSSTGTQSTTTHWTCRACSAATRSAAVTLFDVCTNRRRTPWLHVAFIWDFFSLPKRRFVSRLTITTRKWVELVCVDGYPPDCNARRWPLRLSGACRYLSVVDELTGYR